MGVAFLFVSLVAVWMLVTMGVVLLIWWWRTKGKEG
jgi:hypothetical protein